MLLGYNTNGLAHHRLFDAIELLAEIGYRSVAITVDHGALAPHDDRTHWQLKDLKRLLTRLGMRSVIETGARFLLDPRRKHEPTLVSANPAGRARRVEFYKHCIRCSAELGSDCVSIWSGEVLDGASREEAMARLVERLEEVLRYAAAKGVAIGFEPEPGMLIDTLDQYEDLVRRVDSPRFRLTLDIGHAHCQREGPIPAIIRRWASRLVNVHIEDMRAGVHEHLMFGEGEIDFRPIIETLAESGCQGGVHVELSRHSHDAPAAARHAMEFLRTLM